MRTKLFGPALALSLAAAPLLGSASAELTLGEALRLARENNETTGIAAARVERAAAQRQQAVSLLVPGLELAGVYTRRSKEVTREVGGEEVVLSRLEALNGTATADAVLFDARAIPGIRAATRGLEAQRLESSELERTLAFEVATGFIAVLSAERLQEAAERRIEVADTSTREARLRLEAGLAARNELTRSELELATARLAATEAASLVSTLRLALGYLIDTPVDGPLVEPGPFAVLGRDAGELTERAQRDSAELAALAARAEQARQRAIAPRLGFVPRLEGRGTYRMTNDAGLSGNERDWNATATLTWSLFDGGERAALAAVADAEWREATLQLEARRRRLAVDVERALADLATAEAALAQAQVQADVAAQNAEEVRERFGQGLATALEQADATVARFEADAQLARQGFAARTAQLALAQALGLWPLDAAAPPLTDPLAPERAAPAAEESR